MNEICELSVGELAALFQFTEERKELSYLSFRRWCDDGGGHGCGGGYKNYG